MMKIYYLQLKMFSTTQTIYKLYTLGRLEVVQVPMQHPSVNVGYGLDVGPTTLPYFHPMGTLVVGPGNSFEEKNKEKV